MHLNAHLDVDVVALDTDDTLTVMLELTAPAAAPAEPRAPATFQVVLDRSGSMAGDRLDTAKRALLSLLDRLDPADRFGLVAFDDKTRVVVPAAPLADKDSVRHRIAGIEPGGTTNLSSGYLRGIAEARRAAAGGGATLVLLSDGHANDGVTDADQLADIASGGRTHGVTTSTIGVGLGYDERLLDAVSRAGSGNAHFAEEPDTAAVALAGEVDGLLMQTAQAATLLVQMQSPVASLRVWNDLPSAEVEQGIQIELGDFYSGESRKVLLQFDVPALAALGLAQVATLELSYVELPSLTQHTVTLPVHVNVVPGDAAAGRIPDPTVRTELAFQQAQEAKRRGADALARGDLDEAQQAYDASLQTLNDALLFAPMQVRDELIDEAAMLADLRDRASWDAERVTRSSYSDLNIKSRKRGRPTRPSQPRP